MGKKIWLALGFLGLLGVAGAEKLPENLKGLKADFFCKADIQFYVDGKKDITQEDKLQKILDEYDILYSLNFSKPNPQCGIYTLITIEALSISNGYHIYTSDLNVFTESGGIFVKGLPFIMGYTTIYSIGSFGIRTDKTSFYTYSETMVNNLFKEFALDWKKGK